MLKYVKQHMSSITGIELYPIISFLIFFIFFLVATWLILRADKKHVAKMASMPLEDEVINDRA